MYSRLNLVRSLFLATILALPTAGKAWADEGKITETVARKILETNALEFYGLAPG